MECVFNDVYFKGEVDDIGSVGSFGEDGVESGCIICFVIFFCFEGMYVYDFV